MEYEKLLNTLYYVEHNYDSINELYRKAKEKNITIPKSFVKDWLQKQGTQQQTAQNTKKKLYKPIYSESHYSYQIDLTFLNTYKKSNDGNSVLFTAINVNSRYAYVYYSKLKNVKEVLRMLEQFKTNALEIDAISGDLDSAFTSKECTKWFQNNNIKTFFYKSDSHKLGKINRFHRTLKSKLLKYFTATDNTRWIDVIDSIVKNYNNTINSSINLTPTEASKPFVQSQIISNDREKTNEFKELEIKVGDKCRLLKTKAQFDKMQTNYSNEIYEVIKVNKNTVNIQYNDNILSQVKKSNILVVKESVNSKLNVNKSLDEKENRIQRRLTKEGLK